jgi:hypothetical protein
MADSTSESAAELIKKARELNSAMGNFTSAAGSASSSASDLSNSLSQLSSGAINFAKQLGSGTDTFSRFNGAINELADGTGDLIFAIGKGSPIMIGFGLLAKALGSIAGKVLENDDSIIESYDKIASFGGALGYTTDSLRQAADAAGYPVSNGMFKKLTENMSKISTDLTGLSSTTSGGVKRFMEISKVGPDVLDQFNKLGVSQDKLNQFQAAYVSQQVKLGVARKMKDEDLTKGSIEYAKNLIELAAVTGKSTDAIKESQKTDLDDVAYSIHVRKLMQTEDGQKQYEREKMLAEETERIYGKEGRKAFLEVAATGTVTSEGTKAIVDSLAIGGKDFTGMVKEGIKGQKNRESYAKALQDGQKKQLDNMGSTIGLYSESQLAAMGITRDTAKGQSQIIKDGTEAKVKADIAGAADRKDALKESQNDLRKTGKDVATAFDEFVGLMSGAVHTVLKGLMYGISAFTKGIVNFLEKNSNLLGGIKVDQSVKTMLMSTDELTKRNVEITDELKKAQKERKENALPTSKLDPRGWFNSDSGKISNLVKEQEAITKALDERKRIAGETKAPNSDKPPTATATTTTAPAPPAAQASGQAPPPTPTQGSHADGGVARPPFSGFSGALGGTEATIPLPSGENIPAKIKMPSDLTTNRDSLLGSSDTVQGLMTQYKTNLGAGTPAATAPSGPTGKSNANIFELVASRMDDLIEKMNKNNTIQTELLQLSKR